MVGVVYAGCRMWGNVGVSVVGVVYVGCSMCGVSVSEWWVQCMLDVGVSVVVYAGCSVWRCWCGGCSVCWV